MQAINRLGEIFEIGETVMMRDEPVLYKTMAGKELLILKIDTNPGCQSGYVIGLRDIESGKDFLRSIDTNWLQKLNNNKKQTT